MKTIIKDYEIWRCEVPTGRVIGDCTCHYETLNVFVLALKTDQGLTGWGFGETLSKGVFTKAAPWMLPMPSLDQLRRNFERDVWPLIGNSELVPAWERRLEFFPDFGYQSVAGRTALWDLKSKERGEPLHKTLGSTSQRVRAYGSGLDFPLTDEQAAGMFRKFLRMGLRAVKVKVGAPSPERDLQRLQLVREVVGDNVEIAVDANEAWTCEEALERIGFFTKEGVRLSYVEDPLPRGDIDGFARLNAMTEVDIVGHDSILDARELRRFVQRGAFSRLRVSADIDHALACANIASEFGIPLIFGNSLFELSVHPAVALASTERLEFSDLAWNRLPVHPLEISDGYAIAPSRPGHGFDPDPAYLQEFSRPVSD